MEKTISWTKGTGQRLSPHFSSNEFDCKCKYGDCVTQHIESELLAKLESVRSQVKMPLKITSGFRCAKHQKDLAASGSETATTVSQHELGRAADLLCNDMDLLYAVCYNLFEAIGKARSFIHVDLRNDKRRLWGYLKS